jgi:hypothetical protein
VSAPWWHPEASPLHDIREVMRSFDPSRVRLPRLLIVAPRYSEAQEWARHQDLAVTRWAYVAEPDGLSGVHLGMVAVVNADRLDRRDEWEATLRVLEATGTVVQRGST